jgi:hypothetical protein
MNTTHIKAHTRGHTFAQEPKDWMVTWNKDRPKRIKRDTKKLELALDKAQMSDELRAAIHETLDALKKGDIGRAEETSAVKSFITSNMNFTHDEDGENHFRENGDYNKKVLGDDLYGILDGMTHDLAFMLDRMPAGGVVYTSAGKIDRPKPQPKSPTLKLMAEEEEKIRRGVEERDKKRAPL